jgi:hypothetical protein
VQAAPKLRNLYANCGLLQSIEAFGSGCDAIEKAPVEVAAPELLAKHAERSAGDPIQPTQALILALGIATEGYARPETGRLRH